MFLNNKYTKWYANIIANIRLQNRIRYKKNHVNYIYLENHHIIPKALGGTDNLNNLILLTPKEHFICHWLLTKMCINTFYKQKMLNAFSGMFSWKDKRNLTSKQYQIIKENCKSRIRTSESRAKQSQTNLSKNIISSRKGKTLKEFYGDDVKSLEVGRKISESLKGKTKKSYNKSKNYINSNSKRCTDGINQFNSINEMCSFHKITKTELHKQFLSVESNFNLLN